MKVCIVCQKDVEGKSAVAIKEDLIIRTIRAIKQFFHIATNNELYVCEDDIPVHEQKRKSFERSLLFFGVLGAVVVLLLIGNLFLSGNFDPLAILSAFIIGAFVLLFALVFKYAPALEKTQEVVGGKPSLPPELEELEKTEKEGAGVPKGKKKKR